MTERSEWAVKRTLDVIELRIDMVGKYPVLLEANGRCRAKRDRLWTETYSPTKKDHVMLSTTWVEWLVGAVISDRPVTQQALTDALTGRHRQESLPGF